MKTLHIENQEMEEFISKRYGSDMQSLWKDFATFVKVSLTDSYPSISKQEAKQRVAKAIEEVEQGKAEMLSPQEYETEINEFMKHL
jgi:hypothetical protein